LAACKPVRGISDDKGGARGPVAAARRLRQNAGMEMIDIGDVRLRVLRQGPVDGPPVVFVNGLGTDLRLWDGVVARLPQGLHLVRYDMRGHGGSDLPPPPYTMGALVRDAERLITALSLRDCVIVGLSIGGMVAQGLAAKRLDLVRAVVLSNTAPKIGTRQIWEDRIATLRAGGLAAMTPAIMERWFSAAFRDGPDAAFWEAMVTATPPDGYAGCAAAIAGTDFYTTTAALRLPALVIAGDRDGSTPPDMVRDLASLIPGAQYALMHGVGHLPCAEDPAAYADLLTGFLRDIGHHP